MLLLNEVAYVIIYVLKENTMIKAHFPLYQADDHTIRMIVADMDTHVQSMRYFGEVVHYWKDFPQLTITEEGEWPDGRMKKSCGYTVNCKDLEEYENLYRKIRSVFETQGYVWAVSKGTSPLLREDILAILEKDFWYSLETDSYFYHKFDEGKFSEELQNKFRIIRSHDKWYMMSDYGPAWQNGRKSEEAVRQVLLGDAIATAYAVHVAGDPLRMGVSVTTQKEGYALLGIVPQEYVDTTDDEVVITTSYVLSPCRGFPYHTKRQGSHPDDY